jgi:uncharacterized protein YegP (UPF0339 family)
MKAITSLLCAVAVALSLCCSAFAAENSEYFAEHSVEIVSVSNGKAYIKAVNSEAEPFAAVLIHARYNGDMLDAIRIYPLDNISAEVTEQELLEIGVQKDDKLMVWNSMEEMVSLTDAYIITGNEPVVTEYTITVPEYVTDLTIDGAEAGTNPKAEAGAVIGFKITVPEGYKITAGNVTAAGAGNVEYNEATGVYSFSMPASNTEIKAVFDIRTYTVTFKSKGEEIKTAQVQYNSTAEDIVPSVTADAGYEFLGWVKGDNDEGEIISVWEPIKEDSVYTAKFGRKEYVLTVSQPEHGTVVIKDAVSDEIITLSDFKANVKYGAEFKVIAEAVDGYALKAVSVTYGTENRKLESADGVYTMPADNVNVRAEFERELYTVTASVDGGIASVQLVGEDSVVKTGVIKDNTVTFEGIEAGEYAIQAVLKEDYKNLIISAENNKIIVSGSMTDAFSVTAEEKIKSRVELVTAQNGSLAVKNGDVILGADALEAIYEGTSLTVEVSPDEGYELTKLVYEGTAEGSGLGAAPIEKTDEIYALVMPAEPIKITAEFEKLDRPKYDAENNAVVLAQSVTLQTVVIMDKTEENYYYMDTDSDGFTVQRFLLSEPLVSGEYIIRMKMIDGTVSDAVLSVK